MKRLFLLTLALVSISSYASDNVDAFCPQDSNSKECKAYIAGFVEGYISSKQSYLDSPTEFESAFEKRAFASRASGLRERTVEEKPACLPKKVNVEKIVNDVSKLSAENTLTATLAEYLRKSYPCK